MYKTSSMHVKNIFSDRKISLFSIAAYLLNDNGPQFVGISLTHVCEYLGAKNRTTMAYRPQTSGETENFYWTNVTRL